MAKKIKLPLEMSNGINVRTIEELKKNWDLERVVFFFKNGRLLTWLNDRYYSEQAEQLEKLDGITDSRELQKQLCSIFDMPFVEEKSVDVEAVSIKNKKLDKLRKLTSDDMILKNVDKVAFDQEDFAELLDDDEPIIYLANNSFSIPLSLKNKKYIGIGEVTAVINSKSKVDFDKLKIAFINIRFDAAYEKVLALGQKSERKQPDLSKQEMKELIEIRKLFFQEADVDKSKKREFKILQKYRISFDEDETEFFNNIYAPIRRLTLQQVALFANNESFNEKHDSKYPELVETCFKYCEPVFKKAVDILLKYNISYVSLKDIKFIIGKSRDCNGEYIGTYNFKGNIYGTSLILSLFQTMGVIHDSSSLIAIHFSNQLHHINKEDNYIFDSSEAEKALRELNSDNYEYEKNDYNSNKNNLFAYNDPVIIDFKNRRASGRKGDMPSNSLFALACQFIEQVCSQFLIEALLEILKKENIIWLNTDRVKAEKIKSNAFELVQSGRYNVDNAIRSLIECIHLDIGSLETYLLDIYRLCVKQETGWFDADLIGLKEWNHSDKQLFYSKKSLTDIIKKDIIILAKFLGVEYNFLKMEYLLLLHHYNAFHLLKRWSLTSNFDEEEYNLLFGNGNDFETKVVLMLIKQKTSNNIEDEFFECIMSQMDLEEILYFQRNGGLYLLNFEKERRMLKTNMVFLEGNYELADYANNLNCYGLSNDVEIIASDNTPIDFAANNVHFFNIKIDSATKKYMKEREAIRKEKLIKLREGKFKIEDCILQNLDMVAFEQKELNEILEKVKDKNAIIFLVNNSYEIPLPITNKTFHGIGDVTIVIKSKNIIDFPALGIKLQNFKFDVNYGKILSTQKIYSIAKDYEKAHKHSEAFNWYMLAAEQGHVLSQYKLGDIWGGHSLKTRNEWDHFIFDEKKVSYNKCHELAFEWYKKAAEQNYAPAVLETARYYLNKSEYIKAMAYFNKAVDLGVFEAYYDLGCMYRYGDGVDKNDEMAREYFNKLIDLENRYSCSELQNAKNEIENMNEEKAKKENSACFITTAVCESLNKPDACDELMSMRWLRDRLRVEDSDMATLIEEYYRIAPLIVKKIDKSADAPVVYRQLWENFISAIYNDIKQKDYQDAKLRYIKMLEDLCVRYDESLAQGIKEVIKRVKRRM